MRASGTGVQEIADALRFSLSVVHRWTKDIHLAKPPKKIKPASSSAVTKLERRERQSDDIADAALRKRQQVSLPTTATFTSDDIEWPNEYEDREYDVTGPLPDQNLVAHAKAIHQKWIADAAKGRIFETNPTEVTQGVIIYASTFTLWDYDSFLEHRDQWRAVRKLSRTSSADLAKRTGISTASLTRYEKNQRQPLPDILHTLRTAYVELLEQILVNAERLLAIKEYCSVNGLRPSDPLNFDEILWWITSDHDFDTFNIDHIEPLASVRRWLPYPAWREPASKNLWLYGYPNAPVFQPA
jgi:transcriptional regulator with XRE-family HTH domain